MTGRYRTGKPIRLHSNTGPIAFDTLENDILGMLGAMRTEGQHIEIWWTPDRGVMGQIVDSPPTKEKQ